jgi:type IV pilus assembly protein PilQ
MRSFTIKYGVLKFLTVIAVVCLSWAIAAAETDSDAAESGSYVAESGSDVAESGSYVADSGSAVAETSNEDSEEKTDQPNLEQRMKKRVFVDHNDVPIDVVLRQLAEQADIDIIKSPKVVGTVTVKLTDVPLEEALNNILAVHDCTYVLTNNMMRIITSEEMVAKAEPILTKTYEIVYVDAAQVVDALDKFKSSQGSVSSIKGTSHIIVTDTESKIREISALLDKIDRITPQILVEARIYDITSRDKLDLGAQWDVGQRTDFSEALGGANPTDEISPFTTGWFRGQTTKTSSDTVGALRFGWLNPNLDIDVLLRAEKEITEAKLLANPRILVLDNEQATFDIVTEYPYVERTISSGDITETVKFKEVGVKLVVTPHVTRDGMLRLHIQPEFGVFVERVTLSTTDVPVVDTRKVDTIALVKDGQTVVLGGMRKKDVSKEINKIPLLGDIPIIGGLFRFEGEDTSVTELIVFITPRIVLQEPVLSLDEQLAFEETNFKRPVPSSTRAEKKAAEDN